MGDNRSTTLEGMRVDNISDNLYRDKVILAPMVRAGTLPFRALALHYGADTVFTEEIVDRRVMNAVRTENPVLGTVDYVEPRGKKGTAIPFQTCALERGRVVYQIGTGDAVNALRAAQHVERDVAAVDINMGCPKRFALQGGMGAALLKRPEVAADIVGTLKRNLSVPVSAKIRLLDTPKDTVEFARRMEKAGACALTVHVRKLEDKPAFKARWEELRSVVDAVGIPVVANGDVYTRADMSAIKALSGCSSVMLARPALLNCSIFKPDGNMLPLKEVIQQYLRECIRYDSIYQNAKYTVMEMLTKRRHPDHLKVDRPVRVRRADHDSRAEVQEAFVKVELEKGLDLPPGAPRMREVTSAKTMEQLVLLWDLGADYEMQLKRRKERAEQLGHGAESAGSTSRACIHKFDDAYFLEPETGKTGVSGSECRRNGNGGNARGSPAADSLSLQDDDAHARLKDNNVGEGGAGALRNGGAHETCPTRLTGYEREQEGIEHADRTLSSKSGGMVRVNGHLGGMRQRMDRQIDAHGDETAEKWKISKRPKTTAETGEFV